MFYAHALLKTGNRELAFDVLPDIDLSLVPTKSQYYWKIINNFIRVDFSSIDTVKQEAVNLLDWNMKISRALGYKLFERKALEKKQKLIDTNWLYRMDK